MRRSGSLILCYHRVAEGVDDPFQLCVSPANFVAHLEEIARYGEPSTLTELSIPSRRPRVVVTLDDGYVDNLANALPIAEAKEIPITVFVTSGNLGGYRGFWWDRLGTLLRLRPSGTREICLPTSVGTVSIGLGSSRASVDLQSVRRHLLPLPVAEIHRVLDAVSEHWTTSAAAPLDARSLTPNELLQLAASKVVTIAAHTVDHVLLRDLPAQDQFRTIATSKKELEQLCGQAISHFAYPYGGRDSFDDCSVEAVRSAGFETACTTIPGNATLTSDPYRLPRRIVMNWGRLRFQASLQRWRFVPKH
jgi:peptidoglycan/xylan/chitin deacetylase (PgdA/CDA1 family)